jgi:ApaG protein
MGTFAEYRSLIQVSAVPSPLMQESREEEALFAFAYTIRIQNNSGDTVQLLERHWIIESAGEQIGEVTGAGVVGVQPVLQPGEEFEYTSSVVIKDPVGSMEGSYIFKNVSGGAFVVSIPRFILIYPTHFH